MNNIRALLHSIAVAMFAVAAGTITFGLSESVAQYVVGAAAFIGLIVDTYLASTSTGQNAASRSGRQG